MSLKSNPELGSSELRRQAESPSDGPPSLRNKSGSISSHTTVKSLAGSKAAGDPHRFLGFPVRSTVIILNLILMIIVVTGALAWSWSGHWVGAGMNVLVLCLHSILWFNLFLCKRHIIYTIFLIAYAIIIVLRIIYVLVLLVLFFSQSSTFDSNANDQFQTQRQSQLSAGVVTVLIFIGLVILFLGILLELAVYKLLQSERSLEHLDENVGGVNEIDVREEIRKTIQNAKAQRQSSCLVITEEKPLDSTMLY
ncbi:hypothetical protein Ddc_10686 [Ditylenchus destructor]|nr:hypothetical protein Ddc_10686 [Ditylenchus destructor]